MPLAMTEDRQWFPTPLLRATCRLSSAVGQWSSGGVWSAPRKVIDGYSVDRASQDPGSGAGAAGAHAASGAWRGACKRARAPVARVALSPVWRGLVEGAKCERVRREAGRGLRTIRCRRALDYEVVKQTPDAFELNVTGCRYAKFYQEIGAPELGFLLTCGPDFPFAEGFGGEVQLTRTQTIMQGADHCDFRYKLEQQKQDRG